MRKGLTLLLCALLALTLLTGCGGKKQAGVYWLNSMPEHDGTLQELAALYERATGVQVKVVAASEGTYESMLRSELKKDSPPTLFAMDDRVAVDNFGEYALDLTGTAPAGEMTTGEFNLRDDSGRLVALGCGYTCCGLIVNRALLERAGYSLADIRGFLPLKKAVEDIHARAAELGFDAFAPMDLTAGSADRYTAQLLNVEYWYEQVAARTRWETAPATISGGYVENFHQLFDLIVNNAPVPPAQLAAGGHDARADFNAGKAVFYLGDSGEYASVIGSVPEASMIPYYCGIGGEEKAGLVCGCDARLAVNGQVSDAEKQAALDFLYWCVTDPEASALLVGIWGVMPFKHAAPSANGFLRDAESLAASGCTVMNMASRLQPRPEAYRAAVAAALGQYAAAPSPESWESVRAAIVDGWAVNAAK